MAHQRAVQYRDTDGGVRTAIITTGTKWLQVVMIDAPVFVAKRPLSELKYMRDLDTPVEQAKARYRKAGRHLGITITAKRLLKRTTNNVDSRP